MWFLGKNLKYVAFKIGLLILFHKKCLSCQDGRSKRSTLTVFPSITSLSLTSTSFSISQSHTIVCFVFYVPWSLLFYKELRERHNSCSLLSVLLLNMARQTRRHPVVKVRYWIYIAFRGGYCCPMQRNACRVSSRESQDS
jgi:hypothetical protein